MVTADDVRRLAVTLPRTEEAWVRNQLKFRVRGIVYVALAEDGTEMGFGFPKEERLALVGSDPAKFHMPRKSDERFNWVHVSLDRLDHNEMRELVIDAWCMVVPKRVAAEYLARHGLPPVE